MSTKDLFGLGDRAVARREDPEMSHEAADSVSRERIGEVQRAILRVLEGGPRCDEGIAQLCRLAVSPSGLRSRRAELVARGLVEWAGTYSLTGSGRRTRVWRLVDPRACNCGKGAIWRCDRHGVESTVVMSMEKDGGSK